MEPTQGLYTWASLSLPNRVHDVTKASQSINAPMEIKKMLCMLNWLVTGIRVKDTTER